jgi:C1A family cysteine protease
MRTFVLSVLLYSLGMVAFLQGPSEGTGFAPDEPQENYYLGIFNEFLKSNQKDYKTSGEYLYRYKIFKDHLEKMVDKSRPVLDQIKVEGSTTTTILSKITVTQGNDPCKFTQKLNKFADLSDDEFSQYYMLPPKYFDDIAARPKSVLEFEDKSIETQELNMKLNDDNYDVFSDALSCQQGIKPSNQSSVEAVDDKTNFKTMLANLLSPKSEIFKNKQASETGLTDTCISFIYQKESKLKSTITTPNGTITRNLTKTTTIRYKEQTTAPKNSYLSLQNFGGSSRRLQSYDYFPRPYSFDGSKTDSNDFGNDDYRKKGDRRTSNSEARLSRSTYFNYNSQDSNSNSRRKIFPESDLNSKYARTSQNYSDSSSNERYSKPLNPKKEDTLSKSASSNKYSTYSNLPSNLPSSSKTNSMIFIGGVEVPTYLDWREADIISPVKDQNKCNGCYAFSAIASLEANNALYNDDFTRFSEQELIDCSDENDGCRGGLPSLAFEYIKNQGISTQRDYPYKDLENKARCTRSSRSPKFNSITGYVFAKKGVLSLIKAVQFGPIATLSYASSEFKYYDSGVFDGEGCENASKPNHSSLLIGYNLQSPKPYFILKNGWGEEWGDSGFYKMSIGPLTDDNLGKCLLAATNYNSFPIMKKKTK